MRLTELSVADPVDVWSDLGFAVDDGSVTIGEVALRFDASGRGIVSWGFSSLPEGVDAIDGVAATTSTPSTTSRTTHPNGVIGIDHVVLATPDMGRTVDALTSIGFELRRVRDAGHDREGGLRQQAFFWMGSVILELVGPAEPTGDGPAVLWGLALTADLATAADVLGDRLRPAKEAVQKGRRIATVDRSAGSTVAIALMSPHRAEQPQAE